MLSMLPLACCFLTHPAHHAALRSTCQLRLQRVCLLCSWADIGLEVQAPEVLYMHSMQLHKLLSNVMNVVFPHSFWYDATLPSVT